MDWFIPLLYGFCIGIMALLAGIVFRNDHKSPSHISFFLFALSSILWMASLYSGYYFAAFSPTLSLLFIRLAFGFPSLWYLFLTAFFYYFPNKTFSLNPFLKRTIVGAAILLFLLSSFTPLVEQSVVIENGALVGDVFGKFYLPYTLYFLIHLALALFLGLKKLPKVHGLERKKLLLATSGFWIFLFLAVMTNVVLPLFGILIFQEEAIAFSLFFLIPTFYAIERYRFFDLSTLSLNFLRKFLLFIFSISAVSFLYFFIPYLSPSITDLTRDILSFMGGFLIFLIFDRFFPEFISSSFREFRNALLELRSRLYTCSSYDELQVTLDETFSLNLNIPQAKVYVVLKTPIDLKMHTYVLDEFVREIGQRRITVRDEIEFDTSIRPEKKKIFLQIFRNLNANLCLPLFAENRIIGFFILGRKEKDPAYTAGELEEIMNLQRALEVSLMNILIQNNLQEERNLLKTLVQEKTQSLKKLIQQQSDFMAVTAHEIRTPLSIAIFKTQEILEGLKGKNSSQHLLKEWQIVDMALTHMKDLTQQLFEVQQYELGKIELHPKPVPIIDFLQKITVDFAPLMASKSLEFSFKNNSRRKNDIWINCDEARIRQVLHNLLGNALKFTPKHGKVSLELKFTPLHVRIAICDNGPGIGENEKKNIFEKFQTAKPTLGMGIGLGLYLCAQILELHHGKIWVENSPGGGATFIFELPFAYQDLPETTIKTKRVLFRKKKLHRTLQKGAHTQNE